MTSFKTSDPAEATVLGGPPPADLEQTDPKVVMANLVASIASQPQLLSFVRTFGLSFSSGRRLGGGYYADVYRAYVVGPEKMKRLFSKEEKKKVKIVLKIVDQGRCPKASNYAAELAVCKKIQADPHPNLVTILHLETFTSSGQLWVVMADAGRHHLAAFLAKCSRPKGRLPETKSALLFQQLASALEHLHHRLAVVHRDIKPENVMISKEKGQNEILTLKLIDFGFAALIEDPPEESDFEVKPPVALCTSHKGTLEFMAPELLAPCLFYDAVKSDLYSLGALLYFILHGVAPFVVDKADSFLSMGALIDQFRRLKVETAVSYPLLKRKNGQQNGGEEPKKSAVSSQAQDLINSLLAVKPADRLPLSAVLTHQWLVKKSTSETSHNLPSKCPSTESF